MASEKRVKVRRAAAKWRRSQKRWLEDRDELIAAMREAIAAGEMNQSEIARELDLPRQYVSRMLAGHR